MQSTSVVGGGMPPPYTQSILKTIIFINKTAARTK